MAKNIDFAKIKALSQQILECIGEYPEGENPSLPKQDNQVGSGGVEPNTSFLKSAESDEGETGVGGGKKRKKDSSIAMMGSLLAKSVAGKKY